MLADRISFLCAELERPLLSKSKHEQLTNELNILLKKRELMIKTLSSHNDYFGSRLVDSTEPEDTD